MSDNIIVALDAMGGDNAPTEMVKGAVDAVNANKNIKVILVGKEDVIKDELKAYPSYPQEQISIKNATEEMMQIKEFYGKLDGRVATHGVISLDESESNPKNAGKLMLLLDELMQKVFPDNQVEPCPHRLSDRIRSECGFSL